MASAGQAAGLVPGTLASFMCDALFFQDVCWIGTPSTGGLDSGAPIEASMWRKCRETFREILMSFITPQR